MLHSFFKTLYPTYTKTLKSSNSSCIFLEHKINNNTNTNYNTTINTNTTTNTNTIINTNTNTNTNTNMFMT